MFHIGILGVVGLVLLRLTLGWQFLFAGVEKYTDPEFTSAGFLGQARGPLAERFQAMVPDYYGTEKLDVDRQLANMDTYVAVFASENRFGEAQKAAAKKSLDLRKQELQNYLASISADLADWRFGLEKYGAIEPQPDAPAPDAKTESKKEGESKDGEAPAADKGPSAVELARERAGGEVPFEERRIWDERQKLKRKAAPWIAQVDATWDSLRNDLSHIPVEGKTPGNVSAEVDELRTINLVVTYSNLAIGLCLMVGLFTRFAALGGALFLLPIVLSQPDWPGMYPAPPPGAGRSFIVTKEFVEMVALLALAMLPVGRWGGLDFFIHQLFVRSREGRSD